MQKSKRANVRLLLCLLLLLSAFSWAQPRLSLRELAARVGLPKASVHRLAASLVAMGFMEHRDDGTYSP